MYIAINLQTGMAFWRIFGRSFDDSLATAAAKPGAPEDSNDIALYETTDDTLAQCNLEDMQITIDGGVVTCARA